MEKDCLGKVEFAGDELLAILGEEVAESGGYSDECEGIAFKCYVCEDVEGCEL